MLHADNAGIASRRLKQSEISYHVRRGDFFLASFGGGLRGWAIAASLKWKAVTRSQVMQSHARWSIDYMVVLRSGA